jgi:hypothetical protein
MGIIFINNKYVDVDEVKNDIQFAFKNIDCLRFQKDDQSRVVAIYIESGNHEIIIGGKIYYERIFEEDALREPIDIKIRQKRSIQDNNVKEQQEKAVYERLKAKYGA